MSEYLQVFNSICLHNQVFQHSCFGCCWFEELLLWSCQAIVVSLCGASVHQQVKFMLRPSECLLQLVERDVQQRTLIRNNHSSVVALSVSNLCKIFFEQ